MSRPQAPATEILIDAAAFDEYGGWILDSQFETQMGSSYLLAHGLGVPVEDATTTIDVEAAGTYRIWVHAKDWVPSHHPGRFTISIDTHPLPVEFGAHGRDWCWQDAGLIDLTEGPITISLTDLTGFDGRCSALYLTTDDTVPPDGAGPQARAWRQRLRGFPDEPTEAGTFDVVVVGGGITGSTAAVAAARLGLTVALIQNRPVLGGNASVEIGITPRGETGSLVKELAARENDGDLVALSVLDAEPTVSVFLEHQVFALTRTDAEIASVDARDARTGRETRFHASMFIDCSGTAILGLLAGAQTMFGQESRTDFDEPTAPPTRTDTHHGNTVFFRTAEAESPVDFPDVPWAVQIAKDYANLGGQLERPGTDNAPGPVAGPARTPDPSTRRRMLIPASHFWEYGQDLDPYSEAEHIRDHLLRAIYGTFSNVKTLEPDTYANLILEWVAHVPAQGEFRRYRGDYVLTENDIRAHTGFTDTVAWNSGPFCLHYGGHAKYDFRLRDWKWDTRDDAPFEVPFRCLYSADIDNLMMAGKHISVTHVAGSVTKFMGNGGQHAIATAAAAKVCIDHQATPRDIYERHIDELQQTIATIGGSTGHT
ncbi:FAD-dependent oxidoreductase [Rhodococcus qingshengii]|uniref:FAD-dependent oxidoreductase n=1 Tax=Rhodococcus TaxID=1827 RepID=UPI001BAECE8D|nr:FAD-dependent oxidoreductase [Rhodococcus qingshengii]MBS3695661.1 FAD-dependent oxidoreductase [Rhodococcus qingshengii]